MKKLNIRSLAISGAFLLVLISGVTACGRPAQQSPAGLGAAPQQGANSGSDELQRWQNKPAVQVEGDELQRWAARYSNVRR